MPELPEVETLTRATRAKIEGGVCQKITLLRPDLRWPIPLADLEKVLLNQPIKVVSRRSKYMLWQTEQGSAIFHLGMSGVMVQKDSPVPSQLHTHAVFSIMSACDCPVHIHFVDPRRFGVIDCERSADVNQHKLLKNLGPEPLDAGTDLAKHLYLKSRGRTAPVKNFIMDARIVVGVGNIYASESLYRCGVKPTRAAGKVSAVEYQKMAKAITATLKASIAAGGTTFRDFLNADGKAGYYKIKLNVYDRAGEPCKKCKSAIKVKRLGGRSTFWCPRCQK